MSIDESRIKLLKAATDEMDRALFHYKEALSRVYNVRGFCNSCSLSRRQTLYTITRNQHVPYELIRTVLINNERGMAEEALKYELAYEIKLGNLELSSFGLKWVGPPHVESEE